MTSARSRPAVFARPTTASRSPAKASSARWQCEVDHPSERAFPGGGGSSNDTSIGLPPSGLAASTMPFDSMPISLAGFRLNTITTVRPTSASGSYASAMPATSVRCSVPTSTEQLQQLLRLRHALGREHLRDAKLDLHEVVDGNAIGAGEAGAVPAGAAPLGRRCRRGLRWRAAAKGWCWLIVCHLLAIPPRIVRCAEKGRWVVASRVPGVSVPAFKRLPRRSDAVRGRAFAAVRSPVSGMNGRMSSAMTRTVSAATYSAVSSSGRFDGSLASAQGSRTTIYRFVAPITSQISRSATLN